MMIVQILRTGHISPATKPIHAPCHSRSTSHGLLWAWSPCCHVTAAAVCQPMTNCACCIRWWAPIRRKHVLAHQKLPGSLLRHSTIIAAEAVDPKALPIPMRHPPAPAGINPVYSTTSSTASMAQTSHGSSQRQQCNFLLHAAQMPCMPACFLLTYATTSEGAKLQHV